MALARSTTIVDYLIPTRRMREVTLLRDITLIIASSLLMALSARASIVLPFTPVPITLQTFVLMLVASSLGSRRAALALLLYLVEGASGLPVFASGGGFMYFLTVPSAGYLISYPFAAFVVGWLAERGLERSYKTSILAMLPGTVIIYLVGVVWLSFWLHGNLMLAIQLGMLPFIPGDLIKLFAAAALLPSAWAFVRKFRGEPLVDDRQSEM